MTDQQFAMIESYSHDIPVFQATNLSLGLNLMLELVEKTAGFLGGGFDVEIIEKHHNRKVDAPSGTALVIAETINRAQGNQKYFTYGRHTKNQRRSPSEIGIHAIRGGTIVGEHEALFIGNDETLSIKYSTASRQIYAMGALRAGAFLVGRPPRRYNMSDLLLETSAVTTVMMDSRQAMVTVHRVPADPKLVSSLFTDLAHNNVNVDMISQTAPLQGVVELSFTLPESDLEQMRAVMETYRQARPEMELTLNEDVAGVHHRGPGHAAPNRRGGQGIPGAGGAGYRRAHHHHLGNQDRLHGRPGQRQGCGGRGFRRLWPVKPYRIDPIKLHRGGTAYVESQRA